MDDHAHPRRENDLEELTYPDPGPGRVKLNPKYNVYIDKTELDYSDRWVKNPKEMLRRLFKILIGPEKLKKMSAKGRRTAIGHNRPPIPQDVYRAVESKDILSKL